NNGTKGGRPREISINSHHQIEALQHATNFQKNDYSLIPSNLTWAQYQSFSYREMKSVVLHFHQERHYYANLRYEQITGVLSPIQSNVNHSKHYDYLSKSLCITRKEAILLDHQTRQKIAEELGHSRISITNNYLG
ncbi:integrase, partial [Vibrio splendidus]